ncbi:MAG: hypothetical protein FWF06_06675 [Symbiobacteriaceae bacterium]|nr:hypothetical protein [Symbiobacteriaceae bacterium]
MKRMYGEPFPSLAHRYIYSFMIATPEKANPECGVDEDSQRQFQSFLRSMLEILYSDPALIGMPLLEDKLAGQEEKSELQQMRSKIETKWNQFIDFLVKLGVVGQVEGESLLVSGSAVKIKPRIGQMEAVGLQVQVQGTDYRITCPDFPCMFAAYVYHATRQRKPGRVARRSFAMGYSGWRTETALDCYGSFYPDSSFLKAVEEYCQTNGYTCLNDEWDNRTVRWEKDYKQSKRIMFSVFSEIWRQYQVMYTIRVSDFHAVFAEFESMSDGLREMIMEKASKCSGCKYCIQTDKTGSKPLAVSHLQHRGVTKAVCSYYPFWALHEVSSERAEQLIELMQIADRVLTAKYGLRRK